jgi:putative hydrolases of HD superfamily
MKDITKFFFEVGQLKRVKRTGWWTAGIKDPESVAEHSFRTIVIGKILAELENANSEKVVNMLMIHDIPEARINDLHKLGARYIDHKNAGKMAFKEQLERLPKKIADEFSVLYNEMEDKKTKEAIIAKDADFLECAIQAKEYLEQNYKDAENWIDNVEKGLKTKSAKEILKLVKKSGSNDWWYGLKHIDHLLKNKAKLK